MVSVAFSAADARARLAVEATTDPLTGLANHRAFHERLRQEVARARRHDRPLTVVVFDLDHFKHVNDLHGHQEGDRVLSLVGQRLAAAARSGEMMARIGGEEFGWILPETSADGGLAAAERARTAVSRDAAPTGEPLSVSAGVCDLVEGRDADGLVRLADQGAVLGQATTAVTWRAATRRRSRPRSRPRRGPSAWPGATPSPPSRSWPGPPTPGAERPGTRSAWPTWPGGSPSTSAGRPSGPRGSGRLRCCTISVRWACRPSRRTRTANDTPPWARRSRRRPCPTSNAHGSATSTSGGDGCGVPDGLMGEAIPEGARILAVADAWESAGSAPADTGADGRHWPEAVRALARTVIPGERGSNGSPRPAPRPAA